MTRPRFISLSIFILAALGFLGWRLFYIGHIQHAYYRAIQEAQYAYQVDSAARGSIFIRDFSADSLVLAANSIRTYRVEIVKSELANADRVLNLLSDIVSFDVDAVFAELQNPQKSKVSIPLAVRENELQRIKALKLKGINIIAETKRIYPMGAPLAQVLGFVGFHGSERIGQYGIEAHYNEALTFAQDRPNNESIFSQAALALRPGTRAGADVVLTVDKNVQIFAEDVISNIKKKWSASGASVIIEDPETGAILAMAATPSFDPNSYSQWPAERYLNPSVQSEFEPGSSFKPFTMAAGLELDKITPETTYHDPGVVRVGNYTISNFNQKNFGIQTMTQVLEKSLNTGAIFVVRKVGNEDFRRYVEKFGFGRETGIDLHGEVTGDINNLYQKRELNFLTAAFGQGVAVTPIQLISAYSAIANSGKLMKPYIVSRLVYADGREKTTKPEVVGRPIKPETAHTLQKMLVSVVDRGFDKARIKGYDVAGKTGTAQIADGKGGYSDEFIHDFVGFVPAHDAKFAVLLKLDQPKGIRFSSDSLSPPFAEISRFLINYFGIAPTRQ